MSIREEGRKSCVCVWVEGHGRAGHAEAPHRSASTPLRFSSSFFFFFFFFLLHFSTFSSNYLSSTTPQVSSLFFRSIFAPSFFISQITLFFGRPNAAAIYFLIIFFILFCWFILFYFIYLSLKRINQLGKLGSFCYVMCDCFGFKLLIPIILLCI